MTVEVQVQQLLEELTATEQKLARVVLSEPQTVAFGTVASLARAAGTSGASVVRFANHLGYDGFVELQAAVQEELAGHLRPAVERIRQPAHDDVVGRTLAVELDNVTRSLEAIDRRALSAAAARLAAQGARVAVVPGSASFGVGHHLADQLGLLRAGVTLASGSAASVTATLAALNRTDVVVAIDIHRYDVAVLDSAAILTERGVPLVAITDSVLSPLARGQPPRSRSPPKAPDHSTARRARWQSPTCWSPRSPNACGRAPRDASTASSRHGEPRACSPIRSL